MHANVEFDMEIEEDERRGGGREVIELDCELSEWFKGRRREILTSSESECNAVELKSHFEKFSSNPSACVEVILLERRSESPNQFHFSLFHISHISHIARIRMQMKDDDEWQ
jgi:hypothetical protein